MDFVYIDSKESLDAFSAFVYSLNIDKITYWWEHKEMHYWIIPCLVKSQSLIPPQIWDSTPSTTNTNESQHHWTNALTGIKLTPVEALESRRKVDQNVADEIQLSLESGILTNSNNDLLHRMARNSQCQTATVRKSRESRIDAEAEKRRASTALTKDLKAQLKAVKATSGKRGKSKAKTVILSASSSGRVKMTQSRTAAPRMIATQPEVNDVEADEPLSITVQTEPNSTSLDAEAAALSIPQFVSAQSADSFDFPVEFNFESFLAGLDNIPYDPTFDTAAVD
ncbi:hypothetical protein C8R45DRAFT_1010906, partial [Mycena sanguinolenta]